MCCIFYTIILKKSVKPYRGIYLTGSCQRIRGWGNDFIHRSTFTIGHMGVVGSLLSGRHLANISLKSPSLGLGTQGKGHGYGQVRVRICLGLNQTNNDSLNFTSNSVKLCTVGHIYPTRIVKLLMSTVQKFSNATQLTQGMQLIQFITFLNFFR